MAPRASRHSDVVSVPESNFRDSAYIFVTFLYAAAVHLVIAKANDLTSSETLVRGLLFQALVVLLILFLLSDWASRSRLPRLLPESPRVPGFLHVVKTSLEVIGVFFLLSSFLRIIEQSTNPAKLDTSPATAAFGCFLLATALWDYLLIYIMQKLTLKDLFKAVWCSGDAIDMEATRDEYLGRFNDWKQTRERLISFRRARQMRQLKEDPDHTARTSFFGGLGEYLVKSYMVMFEGAVASLSQFLATHVLQANAIAGIALLWTFSTEGHPILERGFALVQGFLSPVILIFLITTATALSAWFLLRPWASVIAVPISLALFLLLRQSPAAAVWLTLAGVVALIFLLSWFCYLFRKQPSNDTMNWCGGLVIAVPLVLLYLMLPPYLLISLLATQQVLVNIFLQYGVRGRAPRGTTLVANLPM
jgi:hypothetical protein